MTSSALPSKILVQLMIGCTLCSRQYGNLQLNKYNNNNTHCMINSPLIQWYARCLQPGPCW